jgi:hypothetical protein
MRTAMQAVTMTAYRMLDLSIGISNKRNDTGGWNSRQVVDKSDLRKEVHKKFY